MVNVFCPTVNPRIKYAFEVVFKHCLNLDYKIFNKLEDWSVCNGVKLTYGQKIDDCFSVGMHPIILETQIKEQNLRRQTHNHLSYYFPVPNGNLPYDPFAEAFFHCSRYEEYLDTPRDEHGRFQPENSLLFKDKLLETPIVNLLAINLLDELNKFYNTKLTNQRKFKFRVTIDIDQAWKYKNKPLLRQCAGVVRDVLKGNFSLITERLNILLGRKDDPYDVLDLLLKWKAKDVDLLVFILSGEYGPYDKNISLENKAMREWIERLSESVTIGIHPSYQSNKNTEKVLTEKSNLEKVIGTQIKYSRQHFLVCNFPKTFERLHQLDLNEEHTLGYTQVAGFRAGIACSFPFYNLTNEETTDLIFHPFCWMDITPMHYYNLSPELAIQFQNELLEIVKAVNGDFNTLWHNESLSDHGRWKGWKKVWEACIEQAIP